MNMNIQKQRSPGRSPIAIYAGGPKNQPTFVPQIHKYGERRRAKVNGCVGFTRDMLILKVCLSVGGCSITERNQSPLENDRRCCLLGRLMSDVL